MINKKAVITIIIFICAFFMLFAVTSVVGGEDGKTTQSREELISQLPKGKDWKIYSETYIGDYIAAGAYSSDGQSQIVVFKPYGNGKYKVSTRTIRDSSEIIVSQHIIDDKFYDIVWFNGAQTSYARLTYSQEGKDDTIVEFETEDMPVIYNQSPSGDYNLEVIYYDDDGNIYE